ncbi:MAG: hypothetical protein U0234_20230 [Sandaracinus sp.]
MASKTGEGAEGLGSDDLKRMLASAIAGQPRELAFWLARFGGQPSPRVNFDLASGFGAEAAAQGERALKVLAHFAGNDAAPDTSEVFLPMAAAYGYAHLLARGRTGEIAWEALHELAADERAPVRIATGQALIDLAAKKGADALVAHAEEWLADEDRERRWGSLAVTCDVLAERRALDALTDRERWLTVLTALLNDVADAPRAAERSDARRRVCASLPAPIALAAQSFRGTPSGIAWLEERCREAKHVDVRSVLQHAIDRLRKRGASEKVETLAQLGAALASSAKPPRDPARIREGLTGRGKKHRHRGA